MGVITAAVITMRNMKAKGVTAGWLTVGNVKEFINVLSGTRKYVGKSNNDYEK